MSSVQPYFRRPKRSPYVSSYEVSSAGDRVDLSKAHLPDHGDDDLVRKAQSLFDARGAACVSAAVAIDGSPAVGDGPVRIWPAVDWKADGEGPTTGAPWFWSRDLLEIKWYSDAPTVYIVTGKSLAALAYLDFFPDRRRIGIGLRTMVSAAVLAAGPGWCGTWGPDMGDIWDVLFSGNPEGNYDMTQMRLLHMAYQYHDVLSPEARDRLVTVLLAWGRIDRINLDDTFTSGRAPNDWDRAGYISPGGPAGHTNIGETENHILMIATVRYLTNQLLFQRDRAPEHDNRRNGSTDDDDGFGAPCASILLTLLRNFLRDDFSEYNAKSYQEETRWALLNLCTYAYDHEVRLAARMVLDYVSAHVAVSTSDLRRMVPFRRRNEPGNVSQNDTNSMTVALVEGWPNGTLTPGGVDPDPEKLFWKVTSGADPLGKYFAVQAGNLRAFKNAPPAHSGAWEWGIAVGGNELAMEVLSDYRLPPSIHDLFVTDLHRRFYQRLHRTVRTDELGGNHKCDNMEIYAGSPSYLITAGGSPCGYAINPHVGPVVFGQQGQQLGVAVTTSFMPTTRGHGVENDARGLIQFSQFSEGGNDHPPRNYGVAPDFACGHNLYLPDWADHPPNHEGFSFLNLSRWSVADSTSRLGHRRGHPVGPGFYLAIYRSGHLALLEAFDTWLCPSLEFDDFCTDVSTGNSGLRLRENEPFEYTTRNGTRLHAVIWKHSSVVIAGTPVPHVTAAEDFGAEVLSVRYGAANMGEHLHAFSWDALGDAGNVTDRFLNGTVLNSPAEAVVEVTNQALGTKLTLDMSDPWHPRRTSESGAIEQAGNNHEVWLDFDWTGPSAGDVCQPFTTLTGASGAVAAGGVIKVVPGTTLERQTIGAAKRFTLVAPAGGVVIGARDMAERISITGGDGAGENVGHHDVWVQFDFPDSSTANAPGRLPLNNLPDAIGAVADGGVIRIVPGQTDARPTIGGGGKRFTLSAPIGGVVIGA